MAEALQRFPPRQPRERAALARSQPAFPADALKLLSLLQFNLDPHPFRFHEISGQLDHLAAVGIAFRGRLALTRGIRQLEQGDRVGLIWVQ
jgi:hypothetical protein